MVKYSKGLLLIIVVVLSQLCLAQTTTIEAIKKNPAKFDGTEVTVVGLVTQYVDGIGSTSYYLLKGDYGGIIKVNTSEPAPETNSKYKVKGIVYIDQSNNTPFISEKSKEPFGVVFPVPSISVNPNTIEENQTATLTWSAQKATRVILNGESVDLQGSKSVTAKGTTTFTIQAEYPDGTFKEQSATLIVQPQSNMLLYALIALLVILIFAFVYFQFIKKPSLAEEVQEYEREPIHPVQPPSSQTISEAEPIFSTPSEYKTIKIVKSSPKTLKFIPGKLIITDGADRGKEFRIAGYPSHEGFIVSIGRKEVKGERAYAHIELKELTVSREQAELIQKNGKLFIKNLSETNYTQLNGVELQPGQLAEVSPGSAIRTGEVEFQYKL